MYIKIAIQPCQNHITADIHRWTELTGYPDDRAADTASKRITLKIPQPSQLTTPAQSTPAPAAGSQLSFKRCHSIFRGAIGHGMTGFPRALQQVKGTNKYADTGCAGCGSLEHNYTECSAQRNTKKQARETLLDLGRRAQNLTQGPTSPSSWPRSKKSTTNGAPLLT